MCWIEEEEEEEEEGLCGSHEWAFCSGHHRANSFTTILVRMGTLCVT